MLKVKKMSNPTKIIKLVEHSHKTEPYVGLVNENLEDLREVYLGDCLIATHAIGNHGDDELIDAIENARDNNDLESLEDILPGCLSDESFLEEVTAPKMFVGCYRMKPVDGIDYETVEREIP